MLQRHLRPPTAALREEVKHEVIVMTKQCRAEMSWTRFLGASTIYEGAVSITLMYGGVMGGQIDVPAIDRAFG